MLREAPAPACVRRRRWRRRRARHRRSPRAPPRRGRGPAPDRARPSSSRARCRRAAQPPAARAVGRAVRGEAAAAVDGHRFARARRAASRRGTSSRRAFRSHSAMSTAEIAIAATPGRPRLRTARTMRVPARPIAIGSRPTTSSRELVAHQDGRRRVGVGVAHALHARGVDLARRRAWSSSRQACRPLPASPSGTVYAATSTRTYRLPIRASLRHAGEHLLQRRLSRCRRVVRIAFQRAPR